MTDTSQAVQTAHWPSEPSAPAPWTALTVRELLTELAAIEDANRRSRPAAALRSGQPDADALAALAREKEIIDELHRRCPEAPTAS